MHHRAVGASSLHLHHRVLARTTASKVLSGNVGHGLQSSAPRTTVSNTYIGLTTFGLSAVPNGGDGVALLTTATNSRVGDDRGVGPAGAPLSRKPPVIIGGNGGSGVSSDADSTQVSNVLIGIGVQTLGVYPAVGNQGYGVHFDLGAAGSTVGSPDLRVCLSAFLFSLFPFPLLLLFFFSSAHLDFCVQVVGRLWHGTAHHLHPVKLARGRCDPIVTARCIGLAYDPRRW